MMVDGTVGSVESICTVRTSVICESGGDGETGAGEEDGGVGVCGWVEGGRGWRGDEFG